MKLKGFIIRADTVFHYARFFDTYQQFITGKFNYFQLNFGFYQSGRIINAIYGPLFAYLAGGLLVVLKSYVSFQLFTSFLCYTIAGIGMFLLAKKLSNNSLVSYALAIIYMNMGWIPQWQLASNMSTWGATLAPFLIIIAIRMITNHDTPIVWWQLALIMSIIIQIHVLSSVLYVLCLIPFAVVGLILANDKVKMIIAGVKAILATLILSANFLVSYIELTKSNIIAVPNAHYLTSGVLSIDNNTGLSSSAILIEVLLLIGVQLGLVFLNGKLNNWIISLTGLTAFIATTSVFPWDYIQNTYPILMHTFQFPSRILIIAYPLLLAGIAASTASLSKNRKFILIIACFLVAFNCYSVNQSAIQLEASTQVHTSAFKPFSNRQLFLNAYRDKDLNKVNKIIVKPSPDYLAVNNIDSVAPHASSYISQLEANSVNIPSLVMGKFYKNVDTKGSLIIKWHATKKEKITIPINTYSHSIITFNGKKLSSYKTNRVNAPIITQRKGTNTLTLNYRPWLITSCCIILSLVAWIITLLVMLGLGFWRLIYHLYKTHMK